MPLLVTAGFSSCSCPLALDRGKQDEFWAEQLILARQEERRVKQFRSAWDRELEGRAPASHQSMQYYDWNRSRYR